MGSYRNTKPNHTRNFSHQFSSKRLDKLQKMTLQEIIAAELSEEVLLINETEAPQPSSKKQVRRRKSSNKAMKAKKSKKVAKNPRRRPSRKPEKLERPENLKRLPRKPRSPRKLRKSPRPRKPK